MEENTARPASGTAPTSPDPKLPGPFAVGRYARKLQEELRKRARVRLIGEVAGMRRSRTQAYFELRDEEGAVPCAIWLNELDPLALPDGAFRDGAQLVVAGGPDYYRGGGQASPSFCFRATHIRPAGEGDLLARLAALRRQLHGEGLFELQKQLYRPRLPHTIGVVTAEGGAARRDLVAGLQRRGWRGTLVWAFTPVQDRHAAPAITGALQDLAALPRTDVIVVARGGGSLADLWAFCDETLCRTTALLRVPVISAVGHESDSTLIDDVAAVACSTPTHAAEAAVPLDCVAARGALPTQSRRLEAAVRAAVGGRSRRLAVLARGPSRALARQRRELNQSARELRAAGERGVRERGAKQERIASLVLERARARGRLAVTRAKATNAQALETVDRGAGQLIERRRRALSRIAVALRAHDPERTLERGYALVEDKTGEPITRADAAREARSLGVRFADGTVAARVEEDR